MTKWKRWISQQCLPLGSGRRPSLGIWPPPSTEGPRSKPKAPAQTLSTYVKKEAPMRQFTNTYRGFTTAHQGHTNNWSNNQSLFTKAPTKQAIYENAQHHNKYFNWGRYVSSQQSIHRMNNIASQDALSGNRWTEQVKTRPLLPPPRIDQTISETNTVALPTTHFPEPLLKLSQNLSPNL